MARLLRPIHLATVAAFSCASVPAAQAQNTIDSFGGLMGAKVFLSENQCVQGYRSMNFKELIDGECFGNQRAFVRCLNAANNSWAGISKEVNPGCLFIFKDVAFNNTVPYGKYSDSMTISQLRSGLAKALLNNVPYVETISKLERLGLGKIAKLK